MDYKKELKLRDEPPAVTENQVTSHPLSIIQALQDRVTDDMTVMLMLQFLHLDGSSL